jgi:tetratricopeptide (TPR) repeat protein
MAFAGRRQWVMAGVAIVAVCASSAAQTPPDAVDRLEEWVEAIAAHTAGEGDAHAAIVGAWPHAEFARLFPYLEALLELIERPLKAEIRASVSPSLARRPGSDSLPRVSTDDVERLRLLATRRLIQRDRSRFLQRAAILHTDVALRAFGAPVATSSSVGRTSVSHLGASATERVLARLPDGDYRGTVYGSLHWDLARLLVETAVVDDASRDFARRWYRATAATLSGDGAFGEGKPHFARALRLFPHDAALLFSHGCMQEAMASRGVQEFAGATVLPRGMYLDIASTRTHLRRAENLFREALAADPALVEARVRLARVAFNLGRAREAAERLEVALPEAADRVVAYYAHLFLGDAAAALGQADRARQAFEVAAILFPDAQTPRLAVSRVLRAAGDPSAAIAALAPVWALPADAGSRYDPWWDYHRGAGRHVDSLFAELMRGLERTR